MRRLSRTVSHARGCPSGVWALSGSACVCRGRGERSACAFQGSNFYNKLALYLCLPLGLLALTGCTVAGGWLCLSPATFTKLRARSFSNGIFVLFLLYPSLGANILVRAP